MWHTFSNDSNPTVPVDAKVQPVEEISFVFLVRLKTLVAIPEPYIVRTDGCKSIISAQELKTDSVLARSLNQHRQLPETRRVNETSYRSLQ